MNVNAATKNVVLAPARASTLKAAFVAMTLGFGLVWLAGFANPASIHDAAHDTRHALSFPCH